MMAYFGRSKRGIPFRFGLSKGTTCVSIIQEKIGSLSHSSEESVIVDMVIESHKSRVRS